MSEQPYYLDADEILSAARRRARERAAQGSCPFDAAYIFELEKQLRSVVDQHNDAATV